MTTWKKNSEDVRVIDLPFCIQLVAKHISLTLTPSEDLTNAFLYTDAYWTGIIAAKLSTQEVYMTIGPYSNTPSCFLGSLTAGVEVQVDFELFFTYFSDVENIIPVNLGYGDNILPRADDFWHKSTTETPFFWYEAEEEISDFWRERDFRIPITVEADISTAGDMTYEDIKGTIGYWYKTGVGTGYFKTASDGDEVVLGESS
jgi:hypothetical protein